MSTTLVGMGVPFEITDLLAALRERLCGHVVTCEAAHAAAYEINQGDPVPAPAQACCERKRGGSDAERNHVRQGIELAPQR